MLELGVAISMLAAVVGFAVGLAAVAELRQQFAHSVRADRVPLRPQGGSELLMALGDPPQRPHRVAQRDRFDQLAQVLQQSGIGDAQRVPTTAVAPHPAPGQRGVVEILQPPADGAAGQSGRPRHRRQTAVAEGAHLRRCMQAAPSLIQALSSLSAELVAQRPVSFTDGSFINHPAIHRSPGRSGKSLSRSDPNQSWLFLSVA